MDPQRKLFQRSEPAAVVHGYAVVQQRPDLRAAKFSVIHTTRELAMSEAARLALECIQRPGADKDAVYMVLRVEAAVGMRGGKIVDIRPG